MNTRILVTGATGYIGGRLVPLLLEKGFTVRCLVRDPERLMGRGWHGASFIKADVLEVETLNKAFLDIDIAYYLIHSMGQGKGKGFHEKDMLAARNFSLAAKKAGVKRIIYLSGLGDEGDELSAHLKSRHQTGVALRESGVPVTEFRAAQIIGSGSISFEIIRYLVERLPIMVAPKWAVTKSQPIAVDDVLEYLSTAITTPDSTGKIIEIGGSDVLTYKDLLLLYASIRGLRRKLFIVPVLTPELSARWVHLITPIPKAIAKPLITGLRNEVIIKSPLANHLFAIEPMSCKDAIQKAIDHTNSGSLPSIWSESISTSTIASSAPDFSRTKFVQKEGMFIESRQMKFRTTSSRAFNVIQCIGGANGWFYGNTLWRIRGFWDQLTGGVGLLRGRRCNTSLRVGDPLDIWRVEAIEANSLLCLRAEMKIPGQAWLIFKINELSKNKVLVEQTAYFEPKGLLGLLYWYSLVPAHYFIFTGMLNKIKNQAESSSSAARIL